MYYRQLLLFTLFVVILYKMDRTRTDKSIVLARSIFIALLYFLLHQLILSNEGFHFEVTDWKKTCGQDRGMQCDQCCAPGFNGQNVCFDYTGDHERMNMQQAGCSCPAREFPAKPGPARRGDRLKLRFQPRRRKRKSMAENGRSRRG